MGRDILSVSMEVKNRSFDLFLLAREKPTMQPYPVLGLKPDIFKLQLKLSGVVEGLPGGLIKKVGAAAQHKH
jgi:hypothetical protein